MSVPTGFIDEFVRRIVERIYRAFLEGIERLIEDSEGLRNYFRSFIAKLKTLTESTETEWDDYLVKALEYVIDNDDAWAFVYEKIRDLYHMIVDDDEKVGTVRTFDDVALTVEAERLGLNPVLIITIIRFAIEAFKWWRERKNA